MESLLLGRGTGYELDLGVERCRVGRFREGVVGEEGQLQELNDQIYGTSIPREFTSAICAPTV